MTRLRSMLAATSMVVGMALPAATPVSAAPSPRDLFDAAAPMGLTYDFTSRIVTTDQAGIARDQVTLRGRAAILGDKVRIDIEDAGLGSRMNGAYMLAFEGGRRLLWVNPDLKQYYEVESASLMGKWDQIVNGSNGLIKAEASNVRINVEKVGAGPVIEGHETVHYRMTQRMDMKTKVLYKSTNSHDESTIDYYYAPDLQHFINPFLSSSQDMGSSMSFLGAEYMRQIQAAYSKLYQGGAPLKTVVTSKSIDEYGNVRTSTATTEVSNLKSGMLSESLFAIPADYSKVQSADALKSDGAASQAKKPAREIRGRPE
jgi:hypothetical protein